MLSQEPESRTNESLLRSRVCGRRDRNARFDLTTGRSWESGVKGTLAGGRFEMTAAAFQIAQDNILTRDPNSPNITIQGGRQSSTGVEVSLAAVPTPALRIDLNAAFMKAQFDG